MSTLTVLILPFPAQGHVNPMMSFSQKLVEHGCNIIFVNTYFNHNRMVSSSMVKQENINDSPIKLVSIPDGLGPENDRSDLGELSVSMLSTITMPAMLEKLVEDIHLNDDHRITCIVADVGMGWAIEVAHKLRIRGALFWTASAAMFALQYNIPMLIDNGIIDSEVDWWLCNTTYELEPAPLSFVPKLLPIGPLLRSYDNISAAATSLGQFWEEDHSYMSWLDQQPNCSVLYIAFGSSALFDQNQFTELALGLKLTNRPFLWVVGEDCNRGNKMAYPNKFEGHQGKIVGWSSQQKVLSHPAIACFVSHCGWNSTLEGLSNGVPFSCWPYFGDQIYDKTYICQELKVGLGFDKDENGLVSRREIKEKVNQLLNDENIRKRSLVLKEKVLSNLIEGGRSLNNLSRFVKWLKA